MTSKYGMILQPGQQLNYTTIDYTVHSNSKNSCYSSVRKEYKILALLHHTETNRTNLCLYVLSHESYRIHWTSSCPAPTNCQMVCCQIFEYSNSSTSPYHTLSCPPHLLTADLRSTKKKNYNEPIQGLHLLWTSVSLVECNVFRLPCQQTDQNVNIFLHSGLE